MKFKLLFLFPCMVFLSVIASHAQAILKMYGTPDTSGIILSSLPRVEVTAIGHDGKSHTYKGAAMHDILRKSGVQLADKARRDALGAYIVLEAKDNYRVLYSLSELDPTISPNTTILADEVDGKPLDERNGPFQMIVPGEKIHARWIRQVVSLELGRVK